MQPASEGEGGRPRSRIAQTDHVGMPVSYERTARTLDKLPTSGGATDGAPRATATIRAVSALEKLSTPALGPGAAARRLEAEAK